MGGGSGALLEVRRTPLDLFLESFELKQKTELIQISIQMRIYTVGGKANALPSAPDESAFDKIKKEILLIKKGSLQRRSRLPLKPIYRLGTSTLTYHQ
jgi:hypothetical protein